MPVQEIEGKVVSHLNLSPSSKASAPMLGQQEYIPAVQGSGTIMRTRSCLILYRHIFFSSVKYADIPHYRGSQCLQRFQLRDTRC